MTDRVATGRSLDKDRLDGQFEIQIGTGSITVGHTNDKN
jgi:hypothetical protein